MNKPGKYSPWRNDSVWGSVLSVVGRINVEKDRKQCFTLYRMILQNSK